MLVQSNRVVEGNPVCLFPPRGQTVTFIIKTTDYGCAGVVQQYATAVEKLLFQVKLSAYFLTEAQQGRLLKGVILVLVRRWKLGTVS